MTVTLDIGSNDVQHSWWIPELGGKMDALPGYTNKTWFKVTEPRASSGASAPSCAGATTRTCTREVDRAAVRRVAGLVRQAGADDLKAAEERAPREGAAESGSSDVQRVDTEPE